MVLNQSFTSDSTMYIDKMALKIQQLNEQLDTKSQQISDLNSCLVKQTSFCENLSNLLQQSQEKLNKFDLLSQELETTKRELDKNRVQEAKLIKETLSQTQSIISLKLMCSQQENTINQLKNELNSIKEERQSEIDSNSHKAQRNMVALQLKEEENYLLNDQIQKLSKSLDDERRQNDDLNHEVNGLTVHIKRLNEKNSQLDADNNEIKKRLVKLIKEKAELWQKADNLEYENILKNNAMWVDDAHVTHCLTCNNGFSLMLRKHHCRVCLKIYCYYCCNNWIEYNNSKLRVCQRCFEAKAQLNNKIQAAIESNTNQIVSNNAEDEEDESDPDINFEVRSEKLNSAVQSESDELQSIYQTSNPTSNNAAMTAVQATKSTSQPQSNPLVSIEEKTQEKEGNTLMDQIKKLTDIIQLKTAYTDESSDLIVRKKKMIKRKKKPSESKQAPDDEESFAIVSQEEIDRVK